ncbi:MAG: hypothetical protein WAR77_09015, partial [Saprospiraceae bacterium]
MKITTSLNLYIVLFLMATTNAVNAGIVFDGGLSTNAPPPVIGGFLMTPFPADTRALFNDETQVPVPARCVRNLEFSEAASHRVIQNGWATWSHGYLGDVYFVTSQTVTISLPSKTNAFYCYIESNDFAVYTVEAAANDGTTSGPIPVSGNAGATGFAFYTSGNCNLTSITITVGSGSSGFAVGEFGINLECCGASGALACKNVNVSLDEFCQALITPQMLLTGDYICYDAFKVELTHYGKPVGNPIDSHYLNQHIIATVLDTITGNSCWSDILIEDKLAPSIICRADTTDCYTFQHDFPLNYEGSDCSHYTVKTINEQVEHFECNDEYLKAVYREILITDYNGNTDQCTDTILVERIKAEDVYLPDTEVTLYCEFQYSTDENGHPSPYITGLPYTYTHDGSLIYIWPLNLLLDCNILVSYEDLDLGEINCVRKIMRSWTVREWWCNTEITRTQLQIIIIKDTTAPVITHAPYGFEATTGRRDCEARVLLPSIEAEDACHNKLRIDVAYPGGILLGQNGGYVNLPVGEDTIYYRVYDGCYNLTEHYIIIHVRDETEPV